MIAAAPTIILIMLLLILTQCGENDMDITVTDGSNAKVYSVHLRDAPHDGTRAAKAPG